MRNIKADINTVIALGRQGENNAVNVVFDVSGWPDTYGAGAFEILNQRPKETTPYTCSITVEDGQVNWPIQAADVAVPGLGRCELTYVVEEIIVKSLVFMTRILPSIEGGGTVPEPYESRIADQNEAKAHITVEADRAETAREGAEEKKKKKRGGEPVSEEDETYQNNAEFYAHLAEQGASEAGFVWFDVQELTGELIVTVTANLAEDVEFTINNETGELEVLA